MNTFPGYMVEIFSSPSANPDLEFMEIVAALEARAEAKDEDQYYRIADSVTDKIEWLADHVHRRDYRLILLKTPLHEITRGYPDEYKAWRIAGAQARDTFYQLIIGFETQDAMERYREMSW